MMCGKCWKGASGGVPDGDAAHPHYRYGGLWKNRRAPPATPKHGVATKSSSVSIPPPVELEALEEKLLAMELELVAR